MEKKKDYQAAIDAINPVYNSNQYEANMCMGWLNYLAGQNSKSANYYEAAVKQMPDAIEPKLGYMYPTYALGNMDVLVENYKKILAQDPQNSTAIHNLASVYYYKKDYKNALIYWEKYYALYPFEYDAMLYLGWTNLKLEKKVEAKILFEKVLLNQPADKSALEGLEFLTGGKNEFLQSKIYQAFVKNYQYLDKADYKSAIAALKEVGDNTSYELNARLGWLCYTAGLYSESINYYTKAIELKPKALEPRFGIAYPLDALGKKSEIHDHYQTVLTIDPQNSTAIYRIGYINYENKNYPIAYKYFEKLVKNYPFGYDGLLMLAWTNYRLGKNDEAKSLFNKVLLLSPADKSATEGLAMIK